MKNLLSIPDEVPGRSLRRSLCLCLLVLVTAAGNLPAQFETPIQPDPSRDARMEWWREARFGLFIHWGLYSVTEGEWKGEPCRGEYAEHIMRLNRIPFAEYSQLAEEFNPTNFNPEAWAQLAADAGMGYFVLTAKHHDGFAMFDSDVSDYNVVDASPYGKDVFGELAAAFRKKGLRVGAYYSQDLDWSVEQGQGKLYNTWDFNPGEGYEAFDKYFYGKSLPQVKELSTKYGDIDLFWFDIPVMVKEKRGEILYDLVREVQPHAVLSGRVAKPNGLYSDYLTPGDNGYLTSPQPFDWECCATMSETWGYKKNPAHLKTAGELMTILLKSAAAGGNFLLNIGPKPDGTIPEEQVAILKEFARWMKDNRESIRGTTGNPFGEFFGWGYCTAKEPAVYLMVSEWEDGKTISVPRLNNEVEKVEVLGDPGRRLDWRKEGTDVKITLAGAPLHEVATVIKMTCAGDRLDITSPDIAEQNGEILLPAGLGKNRGERIRTLRHEIHNGQALVNFGGRYEQVERESAEYIVWEFTVDRPGTFRITGECVGDSLDKAQDRKVLLTLLPDNTVTTLVTSTDTTDGRIDLGKIQINETGKQKLVLEVRGGRDNAVFLKALRLKRL